MKKIIGQLGLISLLVIPPLGCGNAVDEASKQATRRTALKVESLDSLMKDHPPLAQASLAQIKRVASGSQPLLRTSYKPAEYAPMLSRAPVVLDDVEQPTTPTGEPPVKLEQPVAKKAQDLIDDILDSFDMRVQMRASIKVAGITFNERKAWYLKLKNSDLYDKFESRKGGFGEGGSKFDGEDSGKKRFEEMSCEQIVDGPISKMMQGQFDSVINKNQSAIKNSLSGCAKIRGAEFVSCIKYNNEAADIVNEYGTCSVTSREDLHKILREKMQLSPKEYKKLGMICEQQFFVDCGFEPETPENTRE